MQNPDISLGETAGELAIGSLIVLQKEKGYRFSIDSYLLSAFVDENKETSVLDIGSGSGVVSILLAGIKKLRMTSIEIQPKLAEMSRRSVAINGLEDKIKIVCADIKEYKGPQFEAVVTNPPYRPLGAGRLNPGSQKAVARHELELSLHELLKCVNLQLCEGGRFYAIYPSWRLPDMICEMRASNIEPKRLIMVHSHANSRASLFLIKGIKGAGKEMVVETPLVVYKSRNEYSDIMNQVFAKLVF